MTGRTEQHARERLSLCGLRTADPSGGPLRRALLFCPRRRLPAHGARPAGAGAVQPARCGARVVGCARGRERAAASFLGQRPHGGGDHGRPPLAAAPRPAVLRALRPSPAPTGARGRVPHRTAVRAARPFWVRRRPHRAARFAQGGIPHREARKSPRTTIPGDNFAAYWDVAVAVNLLTSSVF